MKAVRQYITRNPARLHRPIGGSFSDTWLHYAVYHGSLPIAEFLIQSGLTTADADATYGDGKGKSALVEIAASFHPELVRPLLKHGANPRLGRPVVSALMKHDEDVALDVVQALVEAGLDVNKVYDWFGNADAGLTALELAAGKPKVEAYLRGAGAVDRARPVPAGGLSPRDEMVAYFGREFGPVDAKAQTEIVPSTDPPIAVHVVHPNPAADCVTLFTSGLSTRPMDVPDGAEDFRLAELFLQLPAGWPAGMADLARPDTGWPARWLRELAGVPHGDGTWLGVGSTSVTDAGDPPAPAGPGVPFTAAWLIPERGFTRGDGETVKLYRVVPITTPERDLLVRDGVEALAGVLDAAGVGLIVDSGRRSAV